MKKYILCLAIIAGIAAFANFSSLGWAQEEDWNQGEVGDFGTGGYTDVDVGNFDTGSFDNNNFDAGSFDNFNSGVTSFSTDSFMPDGYSPSSDIMSGMNMDVGIQGNDYLSGGQGIENAYFEGVGSGLGDDDYTDPLAINNTTGITLAGRAIEGGTLVSLPGVPRENKNSIDYIPGFKNDETRSLAAFHNRGELRPTDSNIANVEVSKWNNQMTINYKNGNTATMDAGKAFDEGLVSIRRDDGTNFGSQAAIDKENTIRATLDYQYQHPPQDTNIPAETTNLDLSKQVPPTLAQLSSSGPTWVPFDYDPDYYDPEDSLIPSATPGPLNPGQIAIAVPATGTDMEAAKGADIRNIPRQLQDGSMVIPDGYEVPPVPSGTPVGNLVITPKGNNVFNVSGNPQAIAEKLYTQSEEATYPYPRNTDIATVIPITGGTLITGGGITQTVATASVVAPSAAMGGTLPHDPDPLGEVAAPNASNDIIGASFKLDLSSTNPVVSSSTLGFGTNSPKATVTNLPASTPAPATPVVQTVDAGDEFDYDINEDPAAATRIKGAYALDEGASTERAIVRAGSYGALNEKQGIQTTGGVIKVLPKGVYGDAINSMTTGSVAKADANQIKALQDKYNMPDTTPADALQELTATYRYATVADAKTEGPTYDEEVTRIMTPAEYGKLVNPPAAERKAEEDAAKQRGFTQKEIEDAQRMYDVPFIPILSNKEMFVDIPKKETPKLEPYVGSTEPEPIRPTATTYGKLITFSDEALRNPTDSSRILIPGYDGKTEIYRWEELAKNDQFDIQVNENYKYPKIENNGRLSYNYGVDGERTSMPLDEAFNQGIVTVQRSGTGMAYQVGDTAPKNTSNVQNFGSPGPTAPPVIEPGK